MAYYKENEFDKWLKVAYPASVSSYKSGVGTAIAWIDNEKSLWKIPYKDFKVKNFEEYLELANSIDDLETLFSAALNIIQKAINKKPSNKDTLQNLKSQLCAYEMFLKNVFDEEPLTGKGIADNHKKMLRINSSNATYTPEELVKEFYLRILTQDRISMSKKVMFPIRLIRKLWKEESEKWAKSVCGNIWLIVNNSFGTREIQIKDIKSLCIKRTGDVSITDTKDNIYKLYTSYSDPYETLVVENNEIQFKRKRKCVHSCEIPSDGFIIDKNQNVRNAKTKEIILWHIKPIKMKTLGDIAIDHDIPISLVLKEKEKQLTSLKKLSDKYRDMSIRHNVKVSSDGLNSLYSLIDTIEENQLKQCCEGSFPHEDMKIIGKCKLVLMGKDENSIKSDS